MSPNNFPCLINDCCLTDPAQAYVRRKHQNIPIEVETRTLDEVREVLNFLQTDKHTLVKRLMLDNMTKLDPNAPGESNVRCHNTVCPVGASC